MKQLINIFHTLKHLKPMQVRYQLWYRVRSAVRRVTGFRYPLMEISEVRQLQLEPGIPAPRSYDNHHFTFLNETLVAKPGQVPWKDAGKGRLWAYNLNYMDFLLQDDMDDDTGISLIQDFISHLKHNSTGREPYTIALRGINWIKFLSIRFSQEQLNSLPLSLVNDSLLAQYHMLMDQVEYHLMANHLLEDAFSLLFGAVYFNHQPMYRLAEKLLQQELEEQILPDGAHFELSPMYHQILLGRLLDCINLLKNNKLPEIKEELLPLMQRKALLMAGWLSRMTFADGSVPLFNDAAPDIAPDTASLLAYARRLMPLPADAGLQKTAVLKESAYRRFDKAGYTCIADVGGIAPAYQPGHAHADSLGFVLFAGDKPLLIDPGVSTYNAGEQRIRERSTPMHNTVTVKNENSSAVWSAFRVGRRAEVTVTEDTEHKLTASHNGYHHYHTTHRRSWICNDNHLCIEDTLIGKELNGVAHFWLQPGENAELKSNVVTTDRARMTFRYVDDIRLIDVEIPAGYNRKITTKKIEVLFDETMSTNIYLL
jgi:hypothetical protein